MIGPLIIKKLQKKYPPSDFFFEDNTKALNPRNNYKNLNPNIKTFSLNSINPAESHIMINSSRQSLKIFKLSEKDQTLDLFQHIDIPTIVRDNNILEDYLKFEKLPRLTKINIFLDVTAHYEIEAVTVASLPSSLQNLPYNYLKGLSYLDVIKNYTQYKFDNTYILARFTDDHFESIYTFISGNFYISNLENLSLFIFNGINLRLYQSCHDNLSHNNFRKSHILPYIIYPHKINLKSGERPKRFLYSFRNILNLIYLLMYNHFSSFPFCFLIFL